MGYDLYWVNDPYRDDRQARVQRFVDTADLDPLDAAQEMYTVLQADGAYFRASDGVMAAIRRELTHQGLGDFARRFYFNDHSAVTPDQIRHALTLMLDAPTQPPDVSSDLDQFFEWVEDAVGTTVETGGEALMDAPAGAWEGKWARFVAFVRGACDHGGIRVT